MMTDMSKSIIIVIIAMGAAVAGCGGTSEQNDELSFDEAFDAGEPCSVLFEIRNQWDPDSPLIEEANERLRNIGCFSSSSDRTDR